MLIIATTTRTLTILLLLLLLLLLSKLELHSGKDNYFCAPFLFYSTQQVAGRQQADHLLSYNVV